MPFSRSLCQRLFDRVKKERSSGKRESTKPCGRSNFQLSLFYTFHIGLLLCLLYFRLLTFQHFSRLHLLIFNTKTIFNFKIGPCWTLENITYLIETTFLYKAATGATKLCRQACLESLLWDSASSARCTMRSKMFDRDPCASKHQSISIRSRIPKY